MILQPYNGMLFSNIINELSSHKRTQEKPKCILLSEISQFGKTTYYMISTLWHFGKIKTLEKISLVVGKEEETNSWNTEDFQDSKPILCDAVMRDVCHYTFVKIHRKCPGWCGSVGWSLPHKQQLWDLIPGQAHTQVVVQFQAQACKIPCLGACRRQPIKASPSLSPSSLSKKVKKQ